jgi:hypothetical protein
MKLYTYLSLFLLVLTVSACGNFPVTTSEPEVPLEIISTPEPTADVPPTDVPLHEHAIGIRTVDGIGEFYDRRTGEKFVPRGFNYHHMSDQLMQWGETQYTNSTLNTDIYDPGAVETMFKEMSAYGYNIVRVFLTDSVTGITADKQTLNPAYMDNVADFLVRASQNDIYVLFTIDWLPGGKYGSALSEYCCDTFALTNVQILTPGGVESHGNLYVDLYHELIARGAPVEYIFSYELRNELYFTDGEPPLSLNTGVVTTANGRTYDLASADDKKRMLDEGLVYYIDRARAIILEADPTALVSLGILDPYGPVPGRAPDERLIDPIPAVWQSSLDFLDFHPYPGFELSLPQFSVNYAIEGMDAKPILMGETGAFKQNYSSAARGAQALVQWQVESCSEGYDGWLVWHWDAFEDPYLWNAQDEDQAIAKSLAPVNRPDPCIP